MVNPLGYRFRPTDVELVDGYLRPKNGDGDTTDVDRIIGTVNISSFDPWELPSQSVIKSRDQIWYFFGRIEKKYKKGDQQIRKTKSGFWKKTGPTLRVSGRSGKIGEKRVLVFHFDRCKTNWVMHEYHLSPLNPSMEYTICKVEFKGAASEIYSPPVLETERSHSSITDVNNSGGLSSGSDVGQSQNLAALEGFSFESLHSQELQNPSLFSGFPHLEEESRFEDALRKAINNLSDDDFNCLLNSDDQSNVASMQEDYNNYRPRKPLTGVMIGDDSDSDSVYETINSIQTLTTCGSFGSSNHGIDQVTDLHESPNSPIKLVSVTQEVSHSLGQETTIKNKRTGSFYRMIQNFFKKTKLCSFI